MPKMLESTGETHSCECPASSIVVACDLMDSIINTVLEAPGDEDDRFYLVITISGNKIANQTAKVQVQVLQMREIDAPDWYQDWRKIYRSIRLDSPLATRTLNLSR